MLRDKIKNLFNFEFYSIIMTLRLSHTQLYTYLEEKYEKFDSPRFIENDPISIPHKFKKRQDIEISGLISATISWGQRKSIIKNANYFMCLMDNSPFDFVINHEEADLKRFEKAVHRTFNGEDLTFFIRSLKNLYQKYNSLEDVFNNRDSLFDGLAFFYQEFFSIPHLDRTRRHVANVEKGSAAKRMNMYLRWMVRDDGRGVDFGVWKTIKPAELFIPLDVHSGRIARMLGLLQRKQNDWKAVNELTKKLKDFDPNDPVKYDFALFGVGVNEDF